MSIKYVPSGTATLMGELGKAAGEAATSREAADRAERENQEIRRMQQQRDMLIFEQGLEQQAAQRALQFEFQKLEQRSINDFVLAEKRHALEVEYDIQKELRQRQEKDAKIKHIRSLVGKANGVTPEQADLIIAEIETEIPLYSKTISSDPLKAQKAEMYQRAFATAGGNTAPAETPAATGPQQITTEEERAALPSGTVYIDPSGQMRRKA